MLKYKVTPSVIIRNNNNTHLVIILLSCVSLIGTGLIFVCTFWIAGRILQIEKHVDGCSRYLSNLTISLQEFDENIHPWLITDGKFYLNEKVDKNDSCHNIVKEYFIKNDLTVKHYYNSFPDLNGRRLQSWMGTGE